MSQLKIKNGNSWESIPAGGIGVPSGGDTGDVLRKSSSVDYATEWYDDNVVETDDVSLTFTNYANCSITFRKYKRIVQATVSFAILGNASSTAYIITATSTIPEKYRPTSEVRFVIARTDSADPETDDGIRPIGTFGFTSNGNANFGQLSKFNPGVNLIGTVSYIV